MADVFSKTLNELKLPDFVGELPEPARTRDFTPSEAMRLYGVSSGGRSTSGGPIADLLRTARQRNQLQELIEEQQLQTPPRLPTWQETSSSIQGFEELPFSQKQEAYGQWLQDATKAVTEWNPELDAFEVESAFREQNPAPVEPEREGAEVVSDIARGLGAGVLGTAGAIASAVDPTSETAASFRENVAGLREGQSAVEQDVRRQQAFELQQLQADPDTGAIGRFFGEAGIALGNMSLGQASELVGNLAPTLGVGAGVGLGVRGAAALAGVRGARAATLAGRAGTAASIGTGAVAGGGEAAQDAFQRIMDAPLETLQASDEWGAALAEAGGDEQRAREILANDSARLAQTIGTAVSAGLSILPGSLERSVGRAVSGRAARGGLVRAGVRRLGEAGLEGLEEAGTGVAGAIGARTVDPSVALGEGLGTEFALGAFGGGLGGGIVSGAGGVIRRRQEQAEINRRVTKLEDARYEVQGPEGPQVVTGASDSQARARARNLARNLARQEAAQRARTQEAATEQDRRIQERITKLDDGRYRVQNADGETIVEQEDDAAAREQAEEVARTALREEGAEEFITEATEGDTQPAELATLTGIGPTGATLVPQPSGGYAYSEDSEANSVADAIITRSLPEPPTQEQAPVQEQEQTEEAAPEVLPTLPRDLARARPRWRQQEPLFQSDVDRALFITSQSRRSRRDADYRNWLVDQGVPADRISDLGQDVRQQIGDLANATEETQFVVPSIVSPQALVQEAEQVGLTDVDMPTVTADVPVATEAGQERAAQFNTNLLRGARRVGVAQNVIERTESRLAPLVERLGSLEATENPAVSLQEASQELRRLTSENASVGTAIRRALRETPAGEIGPLDGSSIGYLTQQLGVESALSGSREPWANTVRQSTDGSQVLDAIAQDPTVGQVNQNAATALRDAFSAANLPVPQVRYTPRAGAEQGRVIGQYDAANHRVSFNRSSTAASVVHEMLHGLTAEGLTAIQRLADNGDANAQNLINLLWELRAKLNDAAAGRQFYGASAVNQTDRNLSIHELFGELMNPEFLALAAQTPVGEVSTESQAAIDQLGAQPDDTILSVLSRAIRQMIQLITPGAVLSEESIATVLTRVAAQSARTAQQAQTEGPVLRAEQTVPGATPAASERNEATQQGAENIVGSALPEQPRMSYNTLIDDMQQGRAARPETVRGGVTRAFEDGAAEGIRRNLTNFGEFLNRKLHDHTVPVVRWIERLPEGEGGVTPLLKQRVLGDMRRAPVIRDQVLSVAMEQRGGRDLNRAIADISSQYKKSIETVVRDIGYWLTAQRAPAGNQMLVQKDSDALNESIQAYEAALESGENIESTEQARDRAEAQLMARIAAVNNPQTRVRRHGGGGVAGFNNAQAQQISTYVENQYAESDLQRVAELVYNLNAWRLTKDIETGKADPATAAAFLRQPDVKPLLVQLKELADAYESSSQDPNAEQALNAQRERVIEAVKSNYVPLSGDPNASIDDQVFYQGARTPNTVADYALEGRETSIPDDGLSTTFASLLKTATYAGWRDFQDSIADVYGSLSPDNQTAVGMERRKIGEEQTPDNAIIRRRGQSAYAYTLPGNLLDIIRRANVDDQTQLGQWFAKPTRMYSYAATQLNPFFAFRNGVRDFWERSELVRTRTYLDENGNEIDSQQVAKRMLGYLVNPAKNASLINATGRFSFGRQDSGTYEAQMLREWISQGGASIFTDRFQSDKRQVIDNILKMKPGKRQLAAFNRYVSNYNRTFELGAGLAAYIGLREQGVTMQDAAAGSLDLMNFRKRGEVTPVLSTIYAFAQPAITGGANALGSLYNNRTGRWNRVGLTRLVGWTLAFTALQAFARSLADDDEGGNKLDQQSDFLHENYLLFPLGDGILRIPLAFGTTRVANGMARAMIGAGTGDTPLAESFNPLGGKFWTGSVVPVFSPIQGTEIDWSENPMQAFLTTFAPTWMKPPVAVGLNVTPWGSPVVYDQWEKTDEYRSEQYGKFVPEPYGDVARFLRRKIGVDLAPEEVRALIRGYPLGPGTMLLNGLVENPHKEAEGYATENPLIRQIYSGYNDSARYFQFKDAIDETDDLLKEQNANPNFEPTEDQRRLLMWRQSWDDRDNELRSDRGKITRDDDLSEQTKERKYSANRENRRHSQILALYQYRQIKGLDAVRTDIPVELAPRSSD